MVDWCTESSWAIAFVVSPYLIIVQTPDATLVAPKHAEERVREAVKALADNKLDDKL